MANEKAAVLLAELVSVGEETKCLSCHCYLDVLRQVGEDVATRGMEAIPVVEALDEVIGRSFRAQSHDCIGCDPCLPVVPFNALNELFREPVESRGCSCDGDCSGMTSPEPVAPPEVTRSWPPLPGSYRVLDPSASGAVCTLASDDLFLALGTIAPPGVAIVGSMATENLGIERLVRNVVASPAISWLLLCGIDSKGHRAGESLLALSRNGVDGDMRIVGAPGQRARLVNLTPAEVETFRRRVTVFSHLGVTNPDEISDLAEAVLHRPSDDTEMATVTAIPHQAVEHVSDLPTSPRDPYGYFVIDLLSDRKMLRLEHYTNDHLLTNVLTGENARDLYLASIRKGLLSRLDHAAYLGYELSRAEHALLLEKRYVQDRRNTG